METNSLDAILDGGADPAMPAPAPKMEVVEQRQPEPQTGVDDKAEAPPAAAKEEKPHGDWIPRKAVEDERRKRQDLERKLQDIEARLNQPKQEEPPPDWDIDPRTAAERFQYQVQEQLYRTKVEMASELLRERLPDFDDVVSVAVERAKADPRLHQQIVSHPNPAKFAYDVGRKIKFLSEIGDDPESYRSRLEAEILAKHGIQPADGGTLQATDAPAKPATKALPAPVPKSLARDVSQQPRAPNGKWEGPKSLSELLDG